VEEVSLDGAIILKIGLKYTGCGALTGLNWVGVCCFGRLL
jgi:hypothetical protein